MSPQSPRQITATTTRYKTYSSNSRDAQMLRAFDWEADRTATPAHVEEVRIILRNNGYFGNNLHKQWQGVRSSVEAEMERIADRSPWPAALMRPWVMVRSEMRTWPASTAITVSP